MKKRTRSISWCNLTSVRVALGMFLDHFLVRLWRGKSLVRARKSEVARVFARKAYFGCENYGANP